MTLALIGSMEFSMRQSPSIFSTDRLDLAMERIARA
jgi:hypothetical protein